MHTLEEDAPAGDALDYHRAASDASPDSRYASRVRNPTMRSLAKKKAHKRLASRKLGALPRWYNPALRVAISNNLYHS